MHAVFRSTGEDFDRGIIEKALATGAALTPGTDAGLSFFDGLETGIELGAINLVQSQSARARVSLSVPI